jgi:hypothetical protein
MSRRRQSLTFFVGLINGAPAHLAFTDGSITCELFKDSKACRRKYGQIAKVTIEPTIKVVCGSINSDSDLFLR